MRCWPSNWPWSSSAAAVWEVLCGSTPIITGTRAPFSRADRSYRGGQADFGQGQSSVEPLLVGCRQDRTTVLEPTRKRQRGLWSDLPAPWNPTAADPGLLPAFNKSAADRRTGRARLSVRRCGCARPARDGRSPTSAMGRLRRRRSRSRCACRPRRSPTSGSVAGRGRWRGCLWRGIRRRSRPGRARR
jgi:hypothetical protein